MIFKILFAGSLALTAIPAFAQHDNDEDRGEKYVRTEYFTPCSSWTYDFDAGGYVCNFRGSRMTVADGNDVVREFSSLQNTIYDLERRIQALETKLAEKEQELEKE